MSHSGDPIPPFGRTEPSAQREVPVRTELLDYEPNLRSLPRARRAPPPLTFQFTAGVLFPILYLPFAAAFVSAASHAGHSAALAVMVAVAGFTAIALLYRIRLGWKAFIPGAVTLILLALLMFMALAAAMSGRI